MNTHHVLTDDDWLELEAETGIEFWFQSLPAVVFWDRLEGQGWWHLSHITLYPEELANMIGQTNGPQRTERPRKATADEN